MDPAGMDNDTRGWVMCIVSGIACVVGAGIIYVDLFVRFIPGLKHFRVHESNTFLACSLSLSFGVMSFSALNSMLPSSMRYLTQGGMGEQQAGFIMMGCFAAGFLGIQLVSRLFHQLMPSHVVDCDHTHDEPVDDHHAGSHRHRHARSSRGRRRSTSNKTSSPSPRYPALSPTRTNGAATESTPLISTEVESYQLPPPNLPYQSSSNEMLAHQSPPLKDKPRSNVARSRGPSILQVQKRVISIMRDTKANCDQFGPCFGYSDPCGQECLKHLTSRFPPTARSHAPAPPLPIAGSQPPPVPSGYEFSGHDPSAALSNAVRDGPEVDAHGVAGADSDESRADTHVEADCEEHQYHDHHHDYHHDYHHDQSNDGAFDDCSQMSEDVEAQHHHHVPTNAFLSISLQTVIAITVHKFPEGFITYATNHANSSLGFSVFTALFVHNIADGFAIALPLYMALASRVKAMFWASLLGGLSQPIGAAIAVLWFKIANRSHITIDNVAYACVFAATAGIMASVALQLFVESLSLNHNRNLNVFFAFLGMIVLGLSNALVAD